MYGADGEVPLVEAIGDTGMGAMGDPEPPSAWLDKHDEDGDDEGVELGGTRDVFGIEEREPKDEPETEEPEEESTEEADPGTSEEETVAGEGDGDYERAISALRRAKISNGVIGKLTRAEILADGGALSAAQAATDAKFDEHSRTVQSLKEGRGRDESREEPGDVESAGHPSTATLEAAQKTFADAIGVDEATVGPALTSFGTALTEPLMKQLNQGIEVLAQLDSVLGAVLYRGARTELSSGDGAPFPQLADAEVYAPVQAKAKTLLATGDYAHMDPMEGVKAAISDASGILLRSELKDGAKAEVSKEAAAKKRGNVRRPGGKRPSAKLTEFGAAQSVLDRLEASDR